MAHNFNFNETTGRYSFFSVQQKVWHNLGQIVEDYPISAGPIKHAGLDFGVTKAPVFTRCADLSVSDDGEIREGGNILVPDYFATMRTDTNEVRKTARLYPCRQW